MLWSQRIAWRGKPHHHHPQHTHTHTALWIGIGILHRICPFHLNCQIHWHKAIQIFPFNLFNVCGLWMVSPFNPGVDTLCFSSSFIYPANWFLTFKILFMGYQKMPALSAVNSKPARKDELFACQIHAKHVTGVYRNQAVFIFQAMCFGVSLCFLNIYKF